MEFGSLIQEAFRQAAHDTSKHTHGGVMDGMADVVKNATKEMHEGHGSMLKNMTDIAKNATQTHAGGNGGHGAHGLSPGGVGNNVAEGMAGGGHGMGHQMSPFLFGNKKDFFVLFNEAKVTTAAGLAIAIVVSFVFALLATMFSEYSKILESSATKGKHRVSGLLLFSTVTFAFRIFLHYVAMLIVMTMNVWLIIAVVVGHGIGHFLFAFAFQPKPVEVGCEC